MACSGNGAEMGHLIAMVSGLVQGQEQLRADMSQVKNDLREVRQVVNEHTLALADHGRRLNDLSSQVASLREAVTHYHSTVLGTAS
jgi:hypothetical protein